MIKNIQAKTILTTIKNAPDKIFGLTYNMNLYRGCQHGCIYCDSRSNCYRIENLSDILIKQNAIELLEKEISSKRKKGTIGTGSMNDPYMPLEEHIQLTRRALNVIEKYKFPVHIITKSNLVSRDIDILKEIGKTYCAVSITITTENNNLAKMIEPNAPLPSKRFETIELLSKNGINTGITLMPVLPYITDTQQNIKNIILRAKESGAKYIIPWFGVTLRDKQKDYFYNQLDIKFCGIKEKYIKKYGDSYFCSANNETVLYKMFREICDKSSISVNMKFFEEEIPEQISMF